jgi:hypothetical protein
MKHNIIIIVAFILAIGCADNFSDQPAAELNETFLSNYHPPVKHECKWALCPYKGIYPNQWREAVINFKDQEEGTDAFHLDMLHLEFPHADYEELNDLLFCY